jgi:uncharacterized protein
MRILILGVSVRAMVESATNSNYAVVALDAFGDRDLAAMAESHSLHNDFHVRYSAAELFRASRQLDFNAIAYTANLENHPEILSRFAETHRVIGNSPQSVERVRNWETLFPKLKEAGFLVPKTVFPDKNCNLDPENRRLIKPLLSGGGHGIEFLGRDNPPGDHVLLQEYIAGKPCSASFVANGHKCVLVGTTEQLAGLSALGAQGFRYCGNVLPLRETNCEILRQLRGLAAFLTREYGLTGVNGMDFILKDNQVWLTEINPRYSASMELIERAYGLPMFDLHMKAALDGKLPDFKLEAALDRGMYYGKAVLFADRDAVAPDTQGWMDRDFRDVPASGEKLHKGGPICTILASLPTYNGTLADLINKAGALKKEIYG